MNVEDIHDPILRQRFREIVVMTEGQLLELGLNSVIRNRLLAGIVVPPDGNSCWIWQRGFLGRRGPKARPAIWSKGKCFLAYRVMMALILGKCIHALPWVLHKCPGRENCQCVFPAHLKVPPTVAEARDENWRDRERYRKERGERYSRPSHTYLRGRHNPKSAFAGPDGVFLIKTLRATYDAYDDKEGVVPALSRWTERRGKRIAPVSIGKVVRRELHTDVLDDPTAALPPGELEIKKRSGSARRRSHWPSGDSHKGSRIPLNAKKLFCTLFHRVLTKERKLLCDFVAKRYDVKPKYVQGLGYVDPRKFGAPPKLEIVAQPLIEDLTREFLEDAFKNFPPKNQEDGV